MDPHQQSLMQAAHRLGVEVEVLDWGLDAVRYRLGEQAEVVLEGRVFSHLTTVADELAANKLASLRLLHELEIPTPAGMVLTAAEVDAAAVDAFVRTHGVVVAKPVFGTDGQGICMNLTRSGAVLAHLERTSCPGGQWLLEEQVEGGDLRLQWVDGALVAACVRRPCFVVGDGETSVEGLIARRNALIRTQNPDNHIEVDDAVRRRLGEAGITLDTVLAPGTELQLKDVSNMAQGGHAIDVTDAVHPRYAAWMARLAERLGLVVFSLDVMTPDPAADPASAARVLELNARPAWLHHTFSDRRQHDIPTLLLRVLFGLS